MLIYCLEDKLKDLILQRLIEEGEKMSDCIFCKIINKEIPATIVYEDENILAFNDINPVAPVHVLVIPKQHIESLSELNKENVGALSNIYLGINQVAEKLGIKEKGFRVIVNNGKDGGQVVYHLHFHLIGGKSLGNLIL